MSVAMVKVSDIDALYAETKERLNALIAERARRWIEDPDLYFAPDERDRELVGLIHKAHYELLKIEARYLSARGQYLMLGCGVGEHKYCKRQVTREGALLACCCECHQPKEARLEKRNSSSEGEGDKARRRDHAGGGLGDGRRSQNQR